MLSKRFYRFIMQNSQMFNLIRIFALHGSYNNATFALYRMTEISPCVMQELKRIQELCTNHSENEMKEICEFIVKSLLNNESQKEGRDVDKRLSRALASTFVDAARRGIDSERFSTLFESWNGQIAAVIVDVYKRYGNQLRDAMQTIGWEHPKVVGIDWSVLSVVESNVDVEIEEPLSEISFKVVNTDSTNVNTFNFLCNKNQLQDFQWKVREAHNHLQKFYNNA